MNSYLFVHCIVLLMRVQDGWKGGEIKFKLGACIIDEISGVRNEDEHCRCGVIGSKQHSLQAVELSQQTQAAVKIVSNLPAPDLPFFFGHSDHADPMDGWR